MGRNYLPHLRRTTLARGSQAMSLPPRKTRCSLLFVLFLLTLLAPSRALAQDQQPAAQPATAAAESLWSRDLSAWRVAREAEVSAPDGWLTLVGIDWLK